MKISVLLAILLLSMPVYALENGDIEVSINQDRSADWVIKFFSDTPSIYNFTSLYEIENLTVSADGNEVNCNLKKESIGSSILCDTEASDYLIKFKTIDASSNFGNYIRFYYPFVSDYDNLEFSIKLPPGSVLVSQGDLTNFNVYEPVYGDDCSSKCTDIDTDGRFIIIKWITDTKERIDFSLLYENRSDYTPILILVIGFLIGAFLFITFIKKKDIKSMLPVLNKEERGVMEILLIENKGVDQREIIKKLDISKPKMSRIIKNLTERGLVEVERIGRRNIIRAVKTKK